MMNEDIIRMARKAGWITGNKNNHLDDPFFIRLERFEELVRADEREACAKVCEDGVQNATDWDSSYWDRACQNRADAIRTRGNE